MIRRFGLVAVGFLLGLIVSGWSTHAQGPTLDLTLRDVIDILADYSLLHESSTQPQTGPGYWGYTDTQNQLIVITGRADRVDRRSTVLHEFAHIKAKQDALQLSEDDILAIEAELYKGIFGKP